MKNSVVKSIIALCASLLVASCELLVPPRTAEASIRIFEYQASIKPITKAFSSEELDSFLVEFDPGSGFMRFSKDAFELIGKDLRIGDIALGSACEISPAGFLRKVTSISETSDSVILDTEFSDFETAFDDLSIAFRKSLSEEEAKTLIPGKGVAIASIDYMNEADYPADSRQSRDQVIIARLHLDVDKTFTKKDLSLSLKGEVSLTPAIDFSLRLKPLAFVLTTPISASSELEAVISYNSDDAEVIGLEPIDIDELDLTLLKLPDSVFTIGAIPFTWEMAFKGKVEASLSGKLSSGVKSSADVNFGLSYADSNIGFIKEYRGDFALIPPKVEAEGTLKISCGPEVSMQLAGIAGPAIATYPYFSISSSSLSELSLMSEFTTSSLLLKAGVDQRIAGKIEILSEKIEVEKTFDLYAKELLNGTWQTPLSKCPSPIIDPPGGLSDNSTLVSLSGLNGQFIVNYTLDGRDPTDTVGTRYSSPFVVNPPVQVKARAFKLGYAPSSIATERYDKTKYTLTYYGNGNTSGTAPVDKNEYDLGNPVKVAQHGTLAKSGYVFKDWNTSADGTDTTRQEGSYFNIDSGSMKLYAQWIPPNAPQVAKPTISPADNSAGSPYTTVQIVSITCSTPGATIRYTRDDTPPTENSPMYTAPFEIGGSTIIKARAFKKDHNPSAEAKNVIIISIPIPVESITLNVSTLNMVAGGAEYTLSTMITPPNATEQTVVWSSSAPAVASVNAGTVSPKSEGTAIITAKAGNASASCTVNVVSQDNPPEFYNCGLSNRIQQGKKSWFWGDIVDDKGIRNISMAVIDPSWVTKQAFSQQVNLYQINLENYYFTAEPGTYGYTKGPYIVTLTVTDTKGQSSSYDFYTEVY